MNYITKEMVITKIEVQKKNRQRCSVFINEDFAFGMEIGSIAKYDIQKGNEYTLEEYNELLKNLQFENSKSDALRYVGYSPRTVKQTIDKLKDLEYDETIIHQTIDFLKSYNYLDDLDYAQRFILSRITKKRNGRRKVSYDLMQRGISYDISGPIIEEYSQEEYEAAEYLYNRRTKGKDITDYKEKAKITRYLQSRGYTYDIINQVVQDAKQCYN